MPVPKTNTQDFGLPYEHRDMVIPAIKVNRYPSPLPEDMFPNLQGGTIFSMINLSKAYFQLAVDKQAPELLTNNTLLGVFTLNRLPNGAACPPASFQAAMEQITRNTPGTACCLDDVITAC